MPNSPAAVLINLPEQAGAGGHAENDVLINIERVLGSIYADVMFGDDKDNALSGLAGNDALKGGGGSDILVGGFGNDQLDGQDGDDTAAYTGDFDRYAIVDTGPKLLLSGPDGDDELTGIEHLQFNDGRIDLADGNALFDTLYYMQQNRDIHHAGSERARPLQCRRLARGTRSERAVRHVRISGGEQGCGRRRHQSAGSLSSVGLARGARSFRLVRHGDLPRA